MAFATRCSPKRVILQNGTELRMLEHMECPGRKPPLGFHKVMVIDHRDCGAYKVILGEDFAKDPVKETKVHASKLHELKKQVNEKQPKLEVELLLMDLSGKVEAVS